MICSFWSISSFKVISVSLLVLRPQKPVNLRERVIFTCWVSFHTIHVVMHYFHQQKSFNFKIVDGKNKPNAILV